MTENSQIALTPVEEVAVRASSFDALYPPTEKIPTIVVENFPSLGKLAAMRFVEWVQHHPDGVISLPTGKTPEHFIKWVQRLLAEWETPEIQQTLREAGVDPAKKPDMKGLHFVQIDEFYPMDSVAAQQLHALCEAVLYRGLRARSGQGPADRPGHDRPAAGRDAGRALAGQSRGPDAAISPADEPSRIPAEDPARADRPVVHGVRAADSRSRRHRVLPRRHRPRRPHRVQYPRLGPLLDDPPVPDELRDPGGGRDGPGRHRGRPPQPGDYHRARHDHVQSRIAPRSSWPPGRRRRRWRPRRSSPPRASRRPRAPAGAAQRAVLHHARGRGPPDRAAGQRSRQGAARQRRRRGEGPGRSGGAASQAAARPDRGRLPGQPARRRRSAAAARAAGPIWPPWCTTGSSARSRTACASIRTSPSCTPSRTTTTSCSATSRRSSATSGGRTTCTIS